MQAHSGAVPLRGGCRDKRGAKRDSEVAYLREAEHLGNGLAGRFLLLPFREEGARALRDGKVGSEKVGIREGGCWIN